MDLVQESTGDVVVSTTHVDLGIMDRELGIETTKIHDSHILSVVPGLTGLQNYISAK